MKSFFSSVLTGNIHLVSIDTNGALFGRFFGSDSVAAEAWALEESSKSRNLYFTVNEVTPGFGGIKPTKSDIAQVRFAHVDIDPPDDGPWDRDGALMALLAQNPSVVIDSGNGWQGLWRLTQDDADIEETNRGIAHALGADPRVHNKDRLFRVPGTTNYPNATKRARGRIQQPTALILSEPHAFAPETLRNHYPAPARATRTVEGAYDGPYEQDYDPPLPSNRLRDLLWEDIPTGGRSEHAARVAHYMGREGYGYPQILGALLNPQWPWAGTIQDQADPERQARRKLAGVVVWPKGDDMFPDDTPRAATPVLEPPAQTKTRKMGFGLHDGDVMVIEPQLEHFEGCIYVKKDKVVIMPDGSESDHSQFDDTMGGSRFVYTSDGKTTKSAWEAFLRNERYKAPWVHSTCFRPEHPPKAIIEAGGLQLFNKWKGINTRAVDGDATPFVDHVRKLLPNGNDAEILLSYMATCVQKPGTKVQWWPVIQGCPGNGKSLLLMIMKYCLGDEYYHEPDTAKMVRNGIDFNAWIVGSLFIGMEEVYASNRREFLEGFKRYVTNYSITVRPMYGAEYTGDNRANGMILTNHRDGVPVDDDERRYAPFFTAQQSRSDMVRDGMTGDYFPNLWAWLRADGFAIINGFLQSYRVAEGFDKVTLAPITSSTRDAVSASLGRAEQEVMEAVEQGEQGFSGGWISSIMLDKLLTNSKVSVPRNKRKEMLLKLGYIPHPTLNEGRVADVLLPDGGKPRLYVKNGHLSLNVTRPSEVGRMYTEAQVRAQTLVAESKLGA